MSLSGAPKSLTRPISSRLLAPQYSRLQSNILPRNSIPSLNAALPSIFPIELFNMLLNIPVLALATFSTATSAQILAEFVPYKRTEAPAGGWSLSLQTCPSGVPKCGAQWCCPTGLTCIETGGADTAEVCCPGCE